MEQFKQDYVAAMATAAANAEHVFPKMAACEAALESGYGTSGLSIADHNQFGMKQHIHPAYGTANLPTKEFDPKTGWHTIMAEFVKYPDNAACFADRMATLRRLAQFRGYEHYKAALAAADAVTYVQQVSAKWSTDTNRGAKVISIYQAFFPNA